MSNPPELVVLVDENNAILGTMPKSEVHGAETPLHRAFSIFIFNSEKKLLLQQRSHVKKTWPLAWSNSCCGHPGLDESNIDAVKRRLRDELGMSISWTEEAAPYRYQFTKDGVMENEICPIHIGYTEDEPVINPDEVEAIEWISWTDFLEEIHNNTDKYSPWCIEEAIMLEKSGILKEKSLI
jgi:isopentenyl-diphosphate Delta-isomerase